MACAALKRPYNFDVLSTSPQQPLNASPKRRRCGATAVSSPSRTPSAFTDATPRLNLDELASNVQDEWRRIHRRRKVCPSPPSSSETTNSRFLSAQSQLNTWNTQQANSPSKSMQYSSYSPPRSMSPGSMSPSRGSINNQPTFSVKQVISLCERLWKEREEKLKEEYDKVLSDRLAEQYDSFLKFTQDQIMRKYHQSACSYVS